ncbi:MAG: hypothetical protein PWP31_1124 [Clostridia bacterium]|nr:hypothetical protein [Clostridia bacterium]
MIIPTMTVIALRCPSCGRLEFRGLSIFNFSGGGTWQAECSCGTVILTIGTKKGKNFWFQYHCIMCECYHINYYHRKELWSQKLLKLRCNETDLEVGFVGPREEVKKAVKSNERSLTEMAEDLGVGDFFEKPEIMYQLINTIYKLVDAGKVSCSCGNENIEIEIYPGHIQLRCETCGAEEIFPAHNSNDLDKFKSLHEIKLPSQLDNPKKTDSRQRRRRRHRKSPV